jgi:hypothetical protein
MTERRFRINKPDIAFQVIDGESIMINFKSGKYYSAGPVGAEILKVIEAGHALDRIIGWAARRFDSEPGALKEAIQKFIDRLVDEDVIVEDRSTSPPKEDPPVPDGRAAFSTPELHVYTDLQDLLLLDPIHEVDETGWPEKPPPESPGRES